MNEENDFETLRAEIDELRERLDHMTTILGILGVLVVILVIVYWTLNTSGFFFLVLVAILVIPIAIMCRMLEKRGI